MILLYTRQDYRLQCQKRGWDRQDYELTNNANDTIRLAAGAAILKFQVSITNFFMIRVNKKGFKPFQNLWNRKWYFLRMLEGDSLCYKNVQQTLILAGKTNFSK